MNGTINSFMIDELVSLRQQEVERQTRYNHLYHDLVRHSEKPVLLCNCLKVLGKFLIQAGEKLHEMAGEGVRLPNTGAHTLMPKAR